ncbi:MAG TPA: segregation/condensation protein A [Candidatus Paceibacterota bacterium]
MYEVTLEKYKGPLDALLHLIEREEMSVNDISLSQIATSYISYIRGVEGFPMEDVSNFVVIAATLMLIKSRSLMPSLALSEEEETDIKELEERLKTLARFKNLAAHLVERFGKNMMAGRESFSGYSIGFLKPYFRKDEVKTPLFLETIKQIIATMPKREKLPEVKVKTIISLEEKILEVMERIKNSLEVTFSDFSGEEKINVIVSFLAILELIKQGVIVARQEMLFDNIHMRHAEA